MAAKQRPGGAEQWPTKVWVGGRALEEEKQEQSRGHPEANELKARAVGHSEGGHGGDEVRDVAMGRPFRTQEGAVYSRVQDKDHATHGHVLCPQCGPLASPPVPFVPLALPGQHGTTDDSPMGTTDGTAVAAHDLRPLVDPLGAPGAVGLALRPALPSTPKEPPFGWPTGLTPRIPLNN